MGKRFIIHSKIILPTLSIPILAPEYQTSSSPHVGQKCLQQQRDFSVLPATPNLAPKKTPANGFEICSKFPFSVQ